MCGLECLRNVLRSGFHNTGTIPKMSKSKKGENISTSAPCRKVFQQMVGIDMKHPALGENTLCLL